MSFTTVPQSQVPQLIADAASRYGLNSQVLMEQALRESGLIQTKTSSAGAIGVMQLEPSTAADLGVNPYDTTQNIDGGARYLSQLLSEYGGDYSKALAAYDAGPGRVDSALSTAAASGSSDWLSLLPKETQSYVPSILGNLGAQYSISAPGVAAVSVPGNLAQTIFYVALAGVGALFLADMLFG